MGMCKDSRLKLLQLEEFMTDINNPYSYFSIGTYSDEAVCIEKIGNKWVIYEGERGKKYNLKGYLFFSHACDDFFSRISETVQQERHLKVSWKMKNAKISSGLKWRWRRERYARERFARRRSSSYARLIPYVRNIEIEFPKTKERDALYLIRKSVRIDKKLDKTRKQIGKASKVSVPKRNNRTWQFDKKCNSRKY